MAIPTLTQPPTGPPPALARLASEPADAQALQLLRATFAIASAPPLEELAGAAVHLVDRIVAGSVAAGTSTTALLSDAYASLGDPEQTDRLALVERLDACASGLDSVPPAEDGPPASHAPALPLLTVREDGATVLPGMFAPAAAMDRAAPLPAVSAAALGMVATHRQVEASRTIGDVGDIAGALETACLRLAAQVGTLELLAGKDLQRLVNELAATSAAIDGQRRALAAWLAVNGAGDVR